MSQKVTPNFLDRLVTFISPRAGLRRIAAREMLAVYGSYVGARVDRRETMGWMPRAGNADADSLLDLRILRARSRDLMRNAPLASSVIPTMVETPFLVHAAFRGRDRARYLFRNLHAGTSVHSSTGRKSDSSLG